LGARLTTSPCKKKSVENVQEEAWAHLQGCDVTDDDDDDDGGGQSKQHEKYR
jgi:hypothetical protein